MKSVFNFTVLLIYCLMMFDSSSESALQDQPAVLIFFKTAEYRHKSIEPALQQLTPLLEENGFRVHATENAGVFHSDPLSEFRVVVFLNTSGVVLDSLQKSAFQKFIRAGGGYAGIHGATDTEYGWPWYGKLVGAYFKDHPKVQPAVVRVTDSDHISTRHLPLEWPRLDEWYNFRETLSDSVRVLAVVDESTYQGGTNGDIHPFAWCREFDGGRSWYTAGGHTPESYTDPLFLKHILGGILYAAKLDE